MKKTVVFVSLFIPCGHVIIGDSCNVYFLTYACVVCVKVLRNYCYLILFFFCVVIISPNRRYNLVNFSIIIARVQSVLCFQRIRKWITRLLVCTNFLPGPLFFPALRTSCENDVECLPNAVCKNNATASNPRLKICMCKDGFTEEKESCNCN